MSDETGEATAGGGAEERRSGTERRRGGDRRQRDRGIWTLPILRRLFERRHGERRTGQDRRLA